MPSDAPNERAALELQRGELVDDYEIRGVLGRGGMATVYRVRHTALGSDHALKLLRVHGRQVKRRLQAEGRIQARLRHRGLVPVTDLVWFEGQPGLIAELVEGPTLDIWARKASVEERVTAFLHILDAVGYAHSQNIVHRDLKPRNVLMDPRGKRETPRVTDFGIAKILGWDGSGTAQGTLLGTPSYMAPEQQRDARAVDARSDIWSLGIVLYELVAGVTPFPPGMTSAPRAPLPAGTDARIARAIDACLQPDPDDRPASCAQVAEILQASSSWWPFTGR